MDDEARHSDPFEDEFERLGENLRRAVEQAWQSEERKRLSADLQAGIEELGAALNRTANEFAESPTGRRMRAEVDDWSRRVQEGEVADKVESELVSVLGRLNQYLEQVISSMASGPGAVSHDDKT
ncbi:MAG: hypothetical protein P1P76_06185 [Anaerolineales bacterium]|nr:hypothetical protein [Anaerolineales bacterium]